ncbi:MULTISPECIES: hypothetical protein [Pseudomonas]|jgi:hypothetical protein|uniref:Uncharacterized protein n=1 Tax=Pseudomonas gingeri TaxID=117681 RepID=A0A7Y7WGA1_9PSED|nr:hypothetical protein [Pseudomonas gingeri]NWB47964.1 hypothetical protein [Pseudomonas gingeri]
MITETDNGTKKLGELLTMRLSLLNLVKSQKIAFGLAMLGIVALFSAKRLIEWARNEPVAESWVDLTLVLTAYLFFFMIPALQAHISKKLRKRAARLQRQAQEQIISPTGAKPTATPWTEKKPLESPTRPVNPLHQPARRGRTLGR